MTRREVLRALRSSALLRSRALRGRFACEEPHGDRMESGRGDPPSSARIAPAAPRNCCGNQAGPGTSSEPKAASGFSSPLAPQWPGSVSAAQTAGGPRAAIRSDHHGVPRKRRIPSRAAAGAALNLPRPHRRATLPVLGKNRPRCRVLPGVGGSLNGGAPGSTGNSAVRWLRAGLPPVNWQSTCQRQLRTRGLIDRDVPGHGPIHGRAWGDAKVDRTTGFARYLVGIVETELAPAGWMAFLLTRGGDDSKRRLRA